MICDLCQNERPALVRVEDWAVCTVCSSDDTLRRALETVVEVERLKKIFVALELQGRENDHLKEEAERHLTAAEAELHAAIHALVPLAEQRAIGEAKLEHAREALASYQAPIPPQGKRSRPRAK